MTKKDYALIAEALREQRSFYEGDGRCTEAVDSVVIALTERLKQDNPSFDPARFLNACNL